MSFCRIGQLGKCSTMHTSRAVRLFVSRRLRFPLDCLTNDTLDSKVSFLLAGKHVLDRINNGNASFCHAFNGILHGTRHSTAKKNRKEREICWSDTKVATIFK